MNENLLASEISLVKAPKPNSETLDLALSFKSRSNLKGFLAISRDYFFIATIIFINLKFENIWLYLISIWLIGAFQFAISECLLHESSHYNLFASRKLNEYAEIFISLPFFATHHDFKIEHIEHHSSLLKPQDHVYEAYKYFGIIDEKGFIKNINLFWHLIARPFLGISALYYFYNNSNFKSPKVIIFWTILLATAFHFGFLKELFLYWFLPLFWCCGAYLHWSEFLDHYMINDYDGRTRTLGISNFIFHNNGYHATHHQYPYIPFYNLKKAYEKISIV
jgi:fatty acid desaturase